MGDQRSIGALGCVHLCFVSVWVPCGDSVIGYKIRFVVSFLLGKSPASVYYCMPTFRNSLSVPSSKAINALKMETIESSEMSAYNNTLTPGTYPKEKKLQSKHGESLKSRKIRFVELETIWLLSVRCLFSIWAKCFAILYVAALTLLIKGQMGRLGLCSLVVLLVLGVKVP